MPGIFGHTTDDSNINKNNKASTFLLNVVIKEGLHVKTDYATDAFLLKHVCFDFQMGYPFYFKEENLEIWIYGDPIIDSYTGVEAYERLAKKLKARYPGFSGLEDVDGLYSAVVLDKVTKKIFLVGDRDGLCHLYYAEQKGRLYWGSELRAFVNNGNLNLSLRKESVFAFLELGYLIKDNTWFNEVYLLPPASFLEWDLRGKKLQLHQYWSHKSIIGNSNGSNEKKLICDLRDIMSTAVKKRVDPNDNVGITLSGGFDSRTIFANIPTRQKPFTAITRGMKGCGDIFLAKQVVKNRTDVNHVICELFAERWLDGRLEAISATAGQKDIINMSAVASLPIHKQYFDINLDGAGAAAAFKTHDQAYRPTNAFRNKLSKKHLNNHFTFSGEILSELVDYYKEIDSSQYFYLRQRVRRFSVFGSILGHDYGIISRFPFLDLDLQVFMNSLPSTVNRTALFYQMLIKELPEYFVQINNLKTEGRLFANQRLVFLLRVLRYAQRRLGFEKYIRTYHDYTKWLLNNDQGLLDSYGLPKASPLYDHVNQKELVAAIEGFKHKRENKKLVSQIISLNYFLINVLQGK